MVPRGERDSDDDLSPEELARKSEEALNPHIPQFIAKAPWYIQSENSLEHQRLQEKEEGRGISERAKRGVLKQVHIKYRKGACTNCGSMTHQAHDCLERPRKIGAKWTNLDICPDEIIPETKKTRNHDEKRDRWDGFEPMDYQPIVEQFEAIEALAKENRAKKVEESLANSNNTDLNNSNDLDDDMKLREFDDTTFSVSTDKTRTNIRNLRIREDTAKYLRNLDINSAFYDPKSRSMREDPFQKNTNTGDSYRGDNAIRRSGDVSKIILMEAFALRKQSQGESVHLQALPTRSEMMYKASINEESEGNKIMKRISERYGGKICPNVSTLVSEDRPKTLNNHETATGNKKGKVLSKYVEDEYISNHTQIWGSYYDINSKKWGFRCCKQTCRFSKCVPVQKQN